MTRTPEQDEANQVLAAAIEQAVRAHEIFPGSAITLDFVVVVEAAELDENGDYDTEYYGMCFPSGNTRTTIALGLLEKGKSLLLDGECAGDE